MKIVFVNSTRSWGGVKTWTVDYATELIARGHEVRAFVRQDTFAERLTQAGARVTTQKFGFDFSPFTIARFMAAFLSYRPDVVICNVNRDMNTAGMAASILSIPVIQRVGMPRDMRNTARARFLQKFIRPWALCPSQSVANGVYEHMPLVPRDKVKVIRNAKLPVDAIRPLTKRPIQLISTSQVNRDKGHRFVLRALRELPPGMFTYHVVGVGKKLDDYKEKYRDLEERGDLIWHGFSKDVSVLLAKADIFLLPSCSEGMPNALLEAMAAGLIPVSRDIGGVKEIWPDSLEDLLLSRKADHIDFLKALEKLAAMGNDELDKLKLASLNACRETFNLPTKIDEFERWVASEIL